MRISKMLARGNMMKYEVHVRKLCEDDVSRDCHFPTTDQEAYETQLAALASDIGSLPEINATLVVKDSIQIDCNMPEKELLDYMKHLFSDYFCRVRYLSINEVA
ncbi:hypothetical protein FJM67_16275 [Maribrevibacterium harenarium]|uniref:Uncharacterized protein n=1 Tax=Maribrevibacterium harenarium TaxID=2589817 RepID=A0A501WBI2_9GAMM|nr:hypothetical protein [Maribrevibacterium harenarium]TPE45740.1 hypothetical protein FJM67_16275 [Maribrevibacterium harenarium]